MKLFSRRGALFSVAVAPLIAAPTRTNTNKTDEQLVALGLAFDAVTVQLDRSSDLDWELIKEFDRIEAEILAESATTLEGLFVKARIACWGLLGDLEPSQQSNAFDRITLSIIRDLVRLHRPDLERPGAIKRLVKEIAQEDAGLALIK